MRPAIQPVQIIRAGIKKGTSLITDRGRVAVENLHPYDFVLTEGKRFTLVQSIQKTKIRGIRVIKPVGLEEIYVEDKSYVCVREVHFSTETGHSIPVVGTPHWIPAKNINPSKHLLLSPYNPHSIHPYAFRNPPTSAYMDEMEQLWIQIETTKYVNDVYDVYRVVLEEDDGIAVESLILK